ncbi:MAG: dienelactone hydrolase [Planctomycetes bacterium]|nr:dienelactone hydrolase [Planctomycetota bacterium]
MTKRRVACRHSGRLLPVTIWYPTTQSESVRREGIYTLSAAVDAPPAGEGLGIVIVSHGSGGSDTNHHDWAETLARSGFVVAAPRHLGDSHDCNHGMGSRDQLLERPRQLRAALHAVLDDPQIGSRIDRRRVGALGFSAGGYTCLILLGAHPEFSRWKDYCRRHPTSVVLCPVGRAPTALTAADWHDVREPLIRSAVLMAPFALPFSAATLATIDVPIRLYRARDESVARNPANADAVADNLGFPAEVVTVAGDHYVFIAPVEDALARKYSAFYVDADGVDRRRIHAGIGTEIVDFFRRTLPASRA